MASLSRFLVVAKSYGGQFRSIWEHCLLYSNGSTDGDVNKSIEICPTHMVGADHSDVLKNSYLDQELDSNCSPYFPPAIVLIASTEMMKRGADVFSLLNNIV